MNWGMKIAITYTAFVAMIGYMVYISSNQKVDLVDEDYYAQELAYQDRIAKMQNASGLKSTIHWERTTDGLVLHFPDELRPDAVKGKIRFMCPSDKRKDIETSVALDTEGNQHFSWEEFSSMHYRLTVDFEAEGSAYFIEKEIHLN